ncbi:hypothetical protein N7508_001590 [Penicillium antarcticum]|nr:uncharacterized protein N7508_001590 [Penicillium antarcticum]KAJ5317082.1 hypothetical protein N7508_001590 [Penicillium antarcticum]
MPTVAVLFQAIDPLSYMESANHASQVAGVFQTQKKGSSPQ